MSYYINRNKHGQNIGHNSLAPQNIKVEGVTVTHDGTMSRKTFDIANERGLVSHSVGTVKHCTSPEAAQELADLLAANPNYPRH